MAVNRLGPPCPECGSLTTDIIRTLRSPEGHFLRQRKCPCCSHRFSTVQHTEIVAPAESVHTRRYDVTIHWHTFRSYFAKLLTPC